MAHWPGDLSSMSRISRARGQGRSSTDCTPPAPWDCQSASVITRVWAGGAADREIAQRRQMPDHRSSDGNREAEECRLILGQAFEAGEGRPTDCGWPRPSVGQAGDLHQRNPSETGWRCPSRCAVQAQQANPLPPPGCGPEIGAWARISSRVVRPRISVHGQPPRPSPSTQLPAAPSAIPAVGSELDELGLCPIVPLCSRPGPAQPH